MYVQTKQWIEKLCGLYFLVGNFFLFHAGRDWLMKGRESCEKETRAENHFLELSSGLRVEENWVISHSNCNLLLVQIAMQCTLQCFQKDWNSEKVSLCKRQSRKRFCLKSVGDSSRKDVSILTRLDSLNSGKPNIRTKQAVVFIKRQKFSFAIDQVKSVAGCWNLKTLGVCHPRLTFNVTNLWTFVALLPWWQRLAPDTKPAMSKGFVVQISPPSFIPAPAARSITPRLATRFLGGGGRRRGRRGWMGGRVDNGGGWWEGRGWGRVDGGEGGWLWQKGGGEGSLTNLCNSCLASATFWRW